ncbi:ATP-binding protein [Streptomyces acidiscabies]|uniref:ATP-binding protein n=1 Tax=Streptomyces acidiscabies TaxID=42234 RepID=A0AAP6B6V9_9ACTN|nr:ATP-binding protein [Streptomyces acidiscabies]MBP5939760.1 ATP-binding protein [Streptomyces sp. LBUM 1476]MBZ3910941.1 ATP-binding protein [Streptomyces acidiscabies]MDX2959279.1 ATP-binding protein [Streptomyces acidiscabies]MDX3017577.1 ATP-binding protein [Streptomyces acidiscabies]MDX3788052.1 ATP-binding protein [Streptomyces acidiscabies]
MTAPTEPLHHDLVEYTPYPKNVTLARHRAQHLIRDWGHPQLAENTGLLVSELAGNAVFHGTLRGRLFRVELFLTEKALRIEVTDARGELLPVPRTAAPDEHFGRGLMIVEKTADRWGVSELIVGKTVWCELDTA